jgi:predicted transcriptional regulator
MKRTGDKKKPHRLTVTLLAGQRRKLESIAERKHISAATVIRWAVDEYLRRESSNRRGA